MNTAIIIAAITGSSLLNALVILIIGGFIFWVALWFVDWIKKQGLPEPFVTIAKVVLGLAAFIFVVNWLLGLTSHGGFIRW